MAPISPTIPSPQTRHYALLSLVNRALLLPQSEIRNLEPVLDLRTTDRPAQGVGWIFFEHNDWPVYSLDDNLTPQSEPLATQRICVLVNYHDGYFGLMCRNVITLSGTVLRLWPLPAMMTSSESPIQGLARYENYTSLVSTAADLATYLQVGQVEMSQAESG